MLLFRFSDRDSFQFPRKVIEVDPAAKKVASEIHFANADMITSCAFGGPNFDELYVTHKGLEMLCVLLESTSIKSMNGTLQVWATFNALFF